MPPIFRTWSICLERSSRSKPPFLAFRARRSASSRSMVSCARSTSETTSPMPRMRDAIRSGWKGSMASSFSPTPISLIGQPVTARMLSAAPPRPSPSTRVSAMPVRPMRSWKEPRDGDGVLAGQRVRDQQGLRRQGDVAHRCTLGHQLVVDVEAPCGIEQDHVVTLLRARFHGAARDGDRPLAGDHRQHVDLGLYAEGCELFHGRRPAGIERGHQHALLVGHAQEAPELRGRRGLAGALQAHHEDGGRRARGGDADLGGLAAQHLDQVIVHDLDHLVAGRHALQHVGADGLLAHARDEVLDHRERHVRLEQGDAHVAQRGVHVRLAQRAAPRQRLEDPVQPGRQTIEHVRCSRPNGWPAPARDTRGPASLLEGWPVTTSRSARTLSPLSHGVKVRARQDYRVLLARGPPAEPKATRSGARRVPLDAKEAVVRRPFAATPSR